jgi:GR25 family glycosyltransferase involved in LPS biosynthesis
MLFSKIFYINLDRRPERNKHMKKQFKNLSWKGPIERISAVDGKKLTNDHLSLFTQQAIQQSTTKHEQFIPGFYMTKGGMGCALSHRKIYQKIQQEQYQRVLILEDDVILDSGLLSTLESLNSFIPDDFDILYLGYSESKSSKSINEYISQPTGVVFGTFAMILHKRVVNKILNLFPLFGQIDSSISGLFSSIKAYHFNFDKRIIHHLPDPHLNTDVQVMEMFTLNNSQNNMIVWVIILTIIVIIIFNF